jgi:branched-chain amino acid transport system ATP-binding protein
MPTSLAKVAETPIMSITGVSAGYSRVPIIRDVSVDAYSGKIATLIGPNGAGKSTLLKAAMGLIQISAGKVTVGGEDVTNSRPHDLARRGVGYVPQSRDVFDPLTVVENLEMGGYLVDKRELPDRLDEVFALFPVLRARQSQRASNLSGGEKKMLAMGRVIMASPKILLLDEPTANLAPKVADEMLAEHITKLASLGVAILLVEQRAVQALAISSHAYVMVGGSVAMSGHPKELGQREDIAKVFLHG